MDMDDEASLFELLDRPGYRDFADLGFGDLGESFFPDPSIPPPPPYPPPPLPENPAPKRARMVTPDLPAALPAEFPPMENPHPFQAELSMVQKQIGITDRRCTKNLFVSKSFMNYCLQENEKQKAEIQELRAQGQHMLHFWNAQAAATLPRIMDMGALLKTYHWVAVEGFKRRALTSQQAAEALQARLTPTLPVDMAVDLKRVVQALAAADPQKQRLAIGVRFGGMVLECTFTHWRV
jgi:hypothetical protein